MVDCPGYLNSDQIIERLKEIGPFVDHRIDGECHMFITTDSEHKPFKNIYVIQMMDIDGEAFIPENMIDELIEEGKIWYAGGKPCLNQL